MRKKCSSNLIDIGDAELEELLCSERDHSHVDTELDYYDNLNKIFSSNRKMRGGNTATSAGKKSISIWGIKNKKRKKKKR